MSCTYTHNGKTFTAWEFVDYLAAMPVSEVMRYLPEEARAKVAMASYGGWKQTDTPAFKKWFGDWDHPKAFTSKFPVDKTPPSMAINWDNNRPLVLFHATNNDFNEFETGRESITSTTFGPIETRRHAIFTTPDNKFAESYLKKGGGQNVMPVYMDIKAPMDLRNNGAWDYVDELVNNGFENHRWPNRSDTEMWEMFDDETGEAFIAAAKKAGYDGAIMFEVDDNDKMVEVYVAFDPTQIKSAIGNNGDFNGSNPDIRASVDFNIADYRDSAYQSAKSGIDKLTSAETKDSLIYTFQNKFIDLKRIQDAIKGLGKHISELADAYLGEELYHGRLAKRSQDFLANEMRPLLEGLQKAGIAVPEFERFLHARHAVERNAEMAKRNPNQDEIDLKLFEAEQVFDDISERIDNGEKMGKELVQAKKEVSKWRNAQAFDGTEEDRLSLSGMTDDEANSILSRKSPEERKVFDQFAAEIDAINAETMNTLEAYGLETPETIDGWKNKWKHYIPLHRDDAHPDSIGHPTGSGFSTKGSASKRATGSNAKVTNILAHIAMQRESALTRGEKNEVSKKVYLLAQENPDKDLWKAGPPPTQQILNPNTGLVETVIDPLYKQRDNVLMVRINGKDMALTFNERNAQGVRLAMALKNLDGSDLDMVESTVAKGTRWFASINTQFNPIFGIINLLRDSQTGALNLTSTKLDGKQKELVSGIWPALKAIYQQERHGKGDPAWTKLFEEYSLAGGTTGYRDLFARADDRAKALQAEFDKGDRNKASELAHMAADWLSDFNTAMENSTRLAAYKVARDMGLSEAESASIAKNLTVNFNRKGAAATKLGAFYAFFNASLQGSTRMIQTLKGPAGKKIIAGGIGLGFMSAALGMAGMGDDEWEKIPEFVRERSLIIPLPNGKFFTIPMPLGFHVLPNIGRKAAEMAFGSNKKSKAKHLGELMGVVADAFNPMGSSSSVAQMAAPTVLDPVVALLENKDWTGKPIYREDMNGMKPTPGFTRAKDTASTIGTSIAHFLNNATGGTDFTPGMVSWTPDQIDYVFGQLTGGVGREVLKTDQSIRGLATGEDIAPHKIPLLGRFYGETTGGASESAPFYDNVKRINLASAEVKGLREAGRGLEAAEYLKDHPDAKFSKQADKTYREIAKLRKARSEAIERGEKGSVKLIEKNMTEKMRQFNQSVR